MVTAETCFWDRNIGNAKCIDCSCDTKQCALPERCFTNGESRQLPSIGRSRYDNNIGSNKSRFEYKRSKINRAQQNPQKKKTDFISYQNFLNNHVVLYGIWDMWDNLYSDGPILAREYEPPLPLEPLRMVPAPVERLPMLPPPMKPDVQKLFFRRPFDVKKKPFRQLVRSRVKLTPRHKVIFRALNEMRDDIFRNISIINSLEKFSDVHQRHFEDLIAFLMYLNNHELIYD